MLRNYVAVELRNLHRHKLYAVNTLGGLVLGLTCCILCLLFVRDELSHNDRHHQRADRIYRTGSSRPQR